MLDKYYIIKAFEEAVEELASKGIIVDKPVPFTEEMLKKIEYYKEKSIQVKDFEGFMKLIDAILEDLKLNPSTDRPNLASILNGYRLEVNEQPL